MVKRKIQPVADSHTGKCHSELFQSQIDSSLVRKENLFIEKIYDGNTDVDLPCSTDTDRVWTCHRKQQKFFF